MPLAFEQCMLDLKFVDPFKRIFQSAPTLNSKEYNTWLDRVQSHQKDQWENLGIFDMIQLSRTDHMYNPCMLVTLIFFWEGSTNTFQLPCRMITPTLFDVETITCLSPLGEVFNPTLETNLEFNFNIPNFKQYNSNHHD